jgi:hypothetical protein
MPHIRTIIRKSFITTTALVLFVLGAAPVTTGTSFAVDASATSGQCTVPDTSNQAGVHAPTGSDAATFIYQCDGPNMGNWTNAYYLYDSAANTRSQLYSPNYGYNCTSGIWSMDSWDYNAGQHQYSLDRISTPAPAGFATNCPVAPSPASSTTGPAGSTESPSANSLATPNATGPGSTNTANLGIINTTNLNNVTNARVNNGTTAVALSGNALVVGNTSGGSASTGSVSDQANVINLLQSSSNTLGTGKHVTTFTANINGDVNGDLLFDPSTLGSLQNASGATNISNDLTVNNATNASLNNTIDLNATSGNAGVSGNTAGGDATTGSAQAIANVMNYINSAVTAGQSFIGTININGNLNGDILLPPNLIDQLIASNVPTVNVNIPAPNSTNTSNTTVNNNNTVNNTNNEGINNTVNSNAASGQADVSGNTSGGNATTGSAATHVTAFNLTGSTVIGQNDILVFVNVLGTWVGMIVNAPAGSTAAELGGGITRNTTVDNNATLNNTNNFGINNNINVAAKSGDANVTHNTKGGNATTGNANTAVNLLNVEGSTLDLSNWFGILFINVFGTWHGSFGVNTSAGDPIARSQPTAAGPAAGSPPVATSATLQAQVFRFAPRTTGSATTFTSANGGNGNITPANLATPHSAVLAANIKKAATVATAAQLQASKRSLVQPATIIGTLVVLYILSDAIVSHRRRNQN